MKTRKERQKVNEKRAIRKVDVQLVQRYNSDQKYVFLNYFSMFQ